MQDQSEPQTTTNGAPSGNNDLRDVVNSECVGWVVEMAGSRALQIAALDRLVHVGHMNLFAEIFEEALELLEIPNQVRKAMVQYVCAKANPLKDYSVIVEAVKILVNDPSSPMCVKRKGKLDLPPIVSMYGTVEDIEKPRESVRSRANDRAAATKRARQLIAQYKLNQFDSCIQPQEYLEWKYAMLDVIDLSEDDEYVKLEILLNCLAPHTSSEVQLSLSKEYSSMGAGKIFERTFEYLDSCYKNLRSIRHIESTFLNCKMNQQETLPVFWARFQRCSRLYERARNMTLTDNDKIVAFGNAMVPKFRTVASLVETMSESLTFRDYAQKIIYLANSSPAMAALNVIGDGTESADANAAEAERNRKRQRTNEKGEVPPHHQRKGGSCICFRCGESGHMASNCVNSVKDASSRCSRCGVRSHKVAECRVAISRPCHRCAGQHRESICPVPIQSHWKNRPPAASNAMSQFDELQKEMEAGNTVVECECNAAGLVDPTPPMLSVAIGDSRMSSDGLLDSGAAANFIHPDIVLNLFRDKSIRKADVARLPTPIKIRFGNGSIGESDTVLNTTAKWDDRSLACSFIVYANLTPSIIFGRPFLKSFELLRLPGGEQKAQNKPVPELNQIASVNFAWVEEGTTSDGSQRKFLTIRFPLLETLVIEPIREPLRSLSKVSENILLARLRAMEQDGSVCQCSLEQLRVVVPAVIVDKRTGVRRCFPDAELHNRYRVTLDLRGFNKLKMYMCNGQLVLIGATLDGVDKNLEVRAAADQFQHSSFEILRHIPDRQLGCFSKIDIRNAYNSVVLPETMRIVGTEVYDSNECRFVYFQFKTMMQGWKYSPCFFRMVAEFLVQKCREYFEPEVSRNVYIAFYQDDILLSADPNFKHLVVEATETVLKVLESYSFQIRRDKVETAVEQLDFCGYQLAGKTSKPNPSRKKFTAELATKLWVELRDSYGKGETAAVKWVRSVAGIFQYCYGHLGPSQLHSLRRLHSLVSNSTDTSVVKISEYEQPFVDLINFCCNGVPRMFLGAFSPSGRPICSIIITDANQESWAGMLIKIAVSDGADTPMQEILSSLIVQLKQRSVLDAGTYGIYPVRLFGSKFSVTATRQSSTYRERAAMLECVYEAYPLLEGTVFAVCDNKNCQQQWHDIECFGSLLSKLARFQETVADVIWINRDEIPSIVDLVARMVDTELPPIIELSSVESIMQPDDLRGEILAGYRQDTATEYLGVRMSDIYTKVSTMGDERGGIITEGADNITKSAKFFETDKDGYLYFLCGSSYRLYVPNIVSHHIQGGERGLRLALIYRAHCMNDIHVGIYRTLCNTDKFWWPGQRKEIHSFIGSCWICLSKKARLVKTHQNLALSSTSARAIRPFQNWHIDHLGPLQMESGGKYVLVCICAFSHYIYCVEVERVDASTTGVELFRLFTMFGLPNTIHSDQGSAFKNELCHQLTELMNSKQRFSPVAFPRSNGLAEQAVGSVKSMLSTMNVVDLKVALPLICLTHNSMPTNRVSTTALIDLCPFEAAFGFRPRTVSEMDLAILSTQPFTAEIQYFVRRIFRSALAESLQNVDNSSFLSSRIVGFQPGDLVIIIRKSAIQPQKIDGPYVLLSRVGSNIWRMFRLEEGLMVSVTEAPEAILKRFEIHPSVEGFPVKPPIPVKNPSILKRNDYIIIKNSDQTIPSVSLYQVRSNDVTSAKVTARLMRPNQLMEFYATDRFKIIQYEDILLSNFKLSNRLLSEPVQQIISTLLGEGL